MTIGAFSDAEKTAIHEAGHAVVAARLRVGFSYISVVPSPNKTGHVALTHLGAASRRELAEVREFNPQLHGWIRWRLEREITALCAGAAAELFLCGDLPPDGGPGTDADEVNLRLLALYWRKADREACCRRCVRLSNDTLYKAAASVVALAGALLRRRHLRGDEARRVIRSPHDHWGPEARALAKKIDGRFRSAGKG
jgi:hypothetical protein